MQRLRCALVHVALVVQEQLLVGKLATLQEAATNATAKSEARVGGKISELDASVQAMQFGNVVGPSDDLAGVVAVRKLAPPSPCPLFGPCAASSVPPAFPMWTRCIPPATAAALPCPAPAPAPPCLFAVLRHTCPRDPLTPCWPA